MKSCGTTGTAPAVSTSVKRKLCDPPPPGVPALLSRVGLSRVGRPQRPYTAQRPPDPDLHPNPHPNPNLNPSPNPSPNPNPNPNPSRPRNPNSNPKFNPKPQLLTRNPQARDPILFYDEVELYGSDLDDNGAAQLALKVGPWHRGTVAPWDRGTLASPARPPATCQPPRWEQAEGTRGVGGGACVRGRLRACVRACVRACQGFPPIQWTHGGTFVNTCDTRGTAGVAG
jgi:hypothetical protein